MAYTSINFKSKKDLKEAVKAGKQVRCYQPGPFADQCPENGDIFLEGPHYPEPHRWYAQGKMKDGILISVK